MGTSAPPAILKPALIGGAIFGFLGGAPVVGVLNCACCALILGGGLVAALLHSKECAAAGVPFTPARGAKVGFVAGIVYGIFKTLTAALAAVLFKEAAVEWMLMALEKIPNVPPEALELLTGQSQVGAAASVALGLLTNLGLGIIFGTLGGLIGGAILKSK